MIEPKLRRNSSKVLSIITIILAGCILTLPFIIYGISFESDDGLSHAHWYLHFSEQFWAGNLYPRWLPGMNNGLGSPVFFYYPPVPYVLTSLLKPFFPNDIYGLHQLGISASLALIFSGISAYLWLTQIVDQKSALMTAILYIAGPYHLIADLYIRFSFAEFWTFAWLPLILYFTHKVLDDNRLAVIGLAVSYALLIMTHLPTTLIFSLIPIVYAAVLTTDQKLKSLGKVIGSMALGIGLSAVFLYPAMTTQEYVFVEKMSIGYFSYKNWLFFSNFDLWTNDKWVILLLLLDLLGIAIGSFFISRSNLDKTVKKSGLFWLVIAVIGSLMMTELSKPVWLIFYPLQKIQFPFRFCVILTLAGTALIALAISTLHKKDFFTSLFSVKLITFLLIVSSIPVLIWVVTIIFPLQENNQNTENYLKQLMERTKEVPEYRPRWSASMNAIDWETSKDEDNWDLQMDEEYNALLQRVGMTKDGITKIKTVEGVGETNIISWKSREIILRCKTAAGMRIYVSQFYYPNWSAQVIGEQQDVNLQPSQPDGLLSLTIPKGDYEILVKLNQSKAEFAGQIISLVSILFVILYLALIGFSKVRP